MLKNQPANPRQTYPITRPQTVVRTPGGALFELAVTHAEGGWACDESPKELGSAFQLPEQFEDRRNELLAQLEPIRV